MSEVRIPFRPIWEDYLKKGSKTATSRTIAYGKAGDTFKVAGETYVITGVYRKTLHDIANNHFKDEGCINALHFSKLWRALHPIKKWTSESVVYYHTFKRRK